MALRTTFIAISPTHLAFSLSRLKTALEKVSVMIVFDSKMYKKSSYNRVLANFSAIGGVQFLDYGHMVRQWIYKIIDGDLAGGISGIDCTRQMVREMMRGQDKVFFCGGLINPMVRLILKETSDEAGADSRIWYEDGIGEYQHREPRAVHPNIAKAGFAYLFNEDYRGLPPFSVACFYPNLYPVPGPKIPYTDFFTKRSRFYNCNGPKVEKIFADFGSFSTALPISDYIDIVCKSFPPEERRSVYLKLHPSAPETDSNPLEKMGFIPLKIRDSLEDVCTGRTTCYGFMSSALYRLPILTGATTVCLPSGVSQWQPYEAILRKMGVTFRQPVAETA